MEIERKFLVKNNKWKRNASEGFEIKQAYFANLKGKSVRIRTVGEKGFLTIKGPRVGISRDEFEYEIPLADANQLIKNYCDSNLISKKRYKVNFEGNTWEIDEFSGDNQGLILAEIELESPDEKITLPDWLGKEVGTDNRYYNSKLAKHPVNSWNSEP